MWKTFKSMWNYDCPKCRHGKIFTSPFNITKPLDMPEACDICGQETEPEPGFYYGSMFLSYMVGIWFVLLPALFLVFYCDWSVANAMVVSITIEVFIYLWLLRFARSLWLYINVKFDPELHDRLSKSKVQLDAKEWTPTKAQQS